jgi:hypothetical protein
MRSKKALAMPSKPNERHPWRMCPLGQHWVREHTRHCASGKVTSVCAHCHSNPSRLDSLTPVEIIEIADRNFREVNKRPCPKMYEFTDRQNVDQFIAGWTQYWNDIFKPEIPLDPNTVKALIASESSFRNLKPVKDGSGQGKVRGLMQITDATIKILRNRKGELKDHFIDFDDADLMDPNIHICVGIRWLFQKRKLSEAKDGKDVSWDKTIIFYKGYRNKPSAEIDEKMKNFGDFLKKLADCK